MVQCIFGMGKYVCCAVIPVNDPCIQCRFFYPWLVSKLLPLSAQDMKCTFVSHNVGSGEANINVHVYVCWYNCVYMSESLSAQCTLVTSSASMLTLFQVSYALSILFLLLACVWTCNGIYLQYPCKRGARNHTMLNTTAYLLGPRVHNSHCTANFLYIYTIFDVWA